jgi:hypothetical protein
MNATRFFNRFPFSGVLCGLAMLFASGCDQDRGDKRVEQKITCVNNLKQIGLAIRIWAGDHGDKFPFNTSTNAGGTLELCERDKDGFDRNAYRHFQVLAGDEGLRVPSLLICPQDESKKVATDWASLRPENVTYRLRSGTNVSEANPHEILAVCPIDGNILYCDGSVIEHGK